MLHDPRLVKQIQSPDGAKKIVSKGPGRRVISAATAKTLTPMLQAVVSSEGKRLVFPVKEVPEMPRGKGNKLYDIPGKRARERSELMTAVAVVPPSASLVLHSAEQHKTLEWRDLRSDQVGVMLSDGVEAGHPEAAIGIDRGRKGHVRFQKVEERQETSRTPSSHAFLHY